MTEPTGAAAKSADWDRHWVDYADSNALNPAQAYRRDLIFSGLELGRAAPGARLLEIGSGQGELSRENRQAASGGRAGRDRPLPRGAGGGPAEGAGRPLLPAGSHAPDGAPPELRGWATHAVCSEVLEHVEDPVQALRNVRACLAPGCRLVITVPSGPMSAFDRHIGHLRHFTPASLGASLRGAGFEVAELWGAGFPFFNLYRLVVIGRGRALIADAAGDGDGALPLPARVAMRAFSWLFKLNRARTMRGWQLVAIATPDPEGTKIV